MIKYLTHFWTNILIDCRYSHLDELCSLAWILVFVFLWGKAVANSLKQKDKKLAQSDNFNFQYIDDILWLSDSKFGGSSCHISTWVGNTTGSFIPDIQTYYKISVLETIDVHNKNKSPVFSMIQVISYRNKL